MDNNYNSDYKIFYRLSHYIIGGIIGFNIDNLVGKLLLLFILLYQFVQYFYNFRYFILTNQIKKGNCFSHTYQKLSDYLVGFIIVLIIKSLKKNNGKSIFT
jgi:hypothetical protein